jgi:hypothetical protein
MKTKPSNSKNFNSPSAMNDQSIDAALGIYARATPAPGLESRVATRIANSRRESFRVRSAAHRLLWQRITVGTFATAAACGIVVGTLQHSHRSAPPQIVRHRTVSSGGATPAELQHFPAHGIPVTPQIDPRSPRTPAHGRAMVPRNRAHHEAGVAVPRSPYPPDEQPDSQDKPQ